MSSAPCPCNKELRAIAKSHGVKQICIAHADVIDSKAQSLYRQWISDGRNGEMSYMERYDDVRNDPRLLLDGAKSIICCAINYYHPTPKNDNPEIARYAHGDDYHEVVRATLTAIASDIKKKWGGETRVCVDTAPIRERYWAAKAGLGFIGRNNHLIIPGEGSFFFLGEIITTLEFNADKPLEGIGCGNCHACIEACPGRALSPDGSFDARRCFSYLTIEHRGELPETLDLGNHIYGCDECQLACPHNRHAKPSDFKQFHPREGLLQLDRAAWAVMTQKEFSRMLSHSAIKRAKLTGIQRNLRHLS